MVENENLCENHLLKNSLMSFGTFFTLKKSLFLLFLLQKLDHCSRGGPVRVALEVQYGSHGWASCGVSCGGPVCPVYCRWSRKVLHRLPSVQEPVPPSGQTLGETSFCRLGSKRVRWASTATVQALHCYCTGLPGLPVWGLYSYRV